MSVAPRTAEPEVFLLIRGNEAARLLCDLENEELAFASAQIDAEVEWAELGRINDQTKQSLKARKDRIESMRAKFGLMQFEVV